MAARAGCFVLPRSDLTLLLLVVPCLVLQGNVGGP